MVFPLFPSFWTYYPLAICTIGTRPPSGCCTIESRQREQVVGEDCTAHIFHKPIPAGPRAAGESEGALEHRNVGLDPCAEAPKLLVYPGALDHLQYRESSALGERHIANAHFLGIPAVVRRGKAPVCRRLSGGPPVKLFLAFNQRDKKGGVCWIAPFDHTVEDQTRASSHNEELVTEDRLPLPLFDDVRVALEKRNHLLGGWDFFSLDDPAPCLVHHLVKDTDDSLQFFSYSMGLEDLHDLRALEAFQNLHGVQSIGPRLQRNIEEVLVAFRMVALLLVVEDCERPLLRNTSMIRIPVGGGGAQPFALDQEPRDDSHTVFEKTRIRRIVDVRFDSRGIHADRSAFLNSLLFRDTHNRAVERFPCLLGERLDILLERRSTGRLASGKPRKSTEALRISQVEGQLIVGELTVLFQNGAAQHLLSCHSGQARVRLPEPDQIGVDDVQYLLVRFQNLGDSLQFLADGVLRHDVEEILLWVTFFAHFDTDSKGDCDGISKYYTFQYV
jgi:hypothetical protein